MPLKDYLCPPGDGVFTVHTARDKKQALQKKLFNSTDSETVKKLHQQQLQNLLASSHKKIGLLGVCSDTGGGILRGANWGPLFIRNELYRDKLSQCLLDLGDIRVIPHLLHDKYLNETTLLSCREALYGNKENLLAVSPLSITEAVCDELHKQLPQFRMLSLGGDHSVSYPLVKSYLKHKKAQGIKVGLIHFDAHTDLLQKRLGIDLCFGSWLTHVLPYLDSPAQVIQLGIRASGKAKNHWENEFGIHQFWAQEIHQSGIKNIVQQGIELLKEQKVDECYISFDIDALDDNIASATGTPEAGGLSIHQALTAIDAFMQTFPLTGADLVEVAPFTDTDKPNGQTLTLQAAKEIGLTLIKNLAK